MTDLYVRLIVIWIYSNFLLVWESFCHIWIVQKLFDLLSFNVLLLLLFISSGSYISPSFSQMALDKSAGLLTANALQVFFFVLELIKE